MTKFYTDNSSLYVSDAGLFQRYYHQLFLPQALQIINII